MYSKIIIRLKRLVYVLLHITRKFKMKINENKIELDSTMRDNDDDILVDE